MASASPLRRARAALLLCGLLCALYYIATPQGIFGSKAQGDGFLGFHYLPALLLHHTVDMRPSSPRAAEFFDAAPGDRLANRNPIGPALALLPVYTATVFAEAAARALAPQTPTLQGPPYAINELQTFWTGLVTLAAGLAGAALLFRTLRRLLGPGPALAGSLAALLCTPLPWYLTTQPHYQHGLAFAAVTLALCTWERQRGLLSRARFFRVGLLCGLAALLRPQEAVLLIAPGGELLFLAMRALRHRPESDQAARRVVACGLALLAGAVLVFLPQLLAWGFLFGPLRRPPTIELMRFSHPAILEVLFSMRCGLFPWTPVVYLAVPGLLLALRRPPPSAASAATDAAPGLRGFALGALAVLIADVLLVASSWAWYGAFGFGCRRLCDCAPVFALGVAALFSRLRPHRRAWIAALACVVVCAALNLGLMELMRRRAINSSGAEARPAYRWAEQAGAPRMLVSALRHGYPFVQPAGWLFALRHHTSVTTWEAVVGNYALEREAHDMSLSGERWDLRDPRAADWAVEGLGPLDSAAADQGRLINGRLRVLLQPFGEEPIRAELLGALPPGPLALRWDGALLATSTTKDGLTFVVPRALVRPHHVAELSLSLPPGAVARLRELRLHATARWWRQDHDADTPESRPQLHLPSLPTR